jgi:hypothetical protein
MKRAFLSILAMSLCSSAYAGVNGEYVEVIGVDLSDPVPATPPMTIGGLMTGSSGGAGGASVKTGSSVKSSTKDKVKKQKEKRKKKKLGVDASDFIDWLFGLFEPATEAVEKTVESTSRVVEYESKSTTIVRRDPVTGVVTEEKTTKNCKVRAENAEIPNDPCTQLEVKPFTDPEQPNVKKFILTITPVGGVYNPIHSGADQYGYVPRTYGQDSLEFVFTDLQDLRRQLYELQYL